MAQDTSITKLSHDLNEDVEYFKSDRPKTYNFLKENVNMVTLNSTWKDFLGTAYNMHQIFEEQEGMIDVFFHMLWENIGLQGAKSSGV